MNYSTGLSFKQAKSLLSVFIIGLLFSTGAMSAPDKEKSYEYYEDALSYFESGDLASASIQLKNSLKSNKKNLSALLLYGRLYMATGNANAALERYDLARKLGANEETVISLTSEALLQGGRFTELRERYSPQGRSDRLKVIINVYLGRAELGDGNPKLALPLFKKAATIMPDAAEPKVAIARIYLQQGITDTAQVLIKDAIKNAPDYAAAWKLRGDMYRSQGKLNKAINDYTQAISIDPLAFSARTTRAAVYLDHKQQIKLAIKDIKVILTAQPYNVYANYLHGIALARTGKDDQSKKAFDLVERSLEVLGTSYILNHPPTLLIAGSLHFKQQKFDLASSELSRYLRSNPRHTGARKMLGSILLTRNKPVEALKILEPALRLTPEDPQLLALLGSAYMKTRQFSYASIALQRAVELAPDSSSIQTQFAMSKLATGHKKEALQVLETALKADPDARNVAVMIGFIKIKNKDFTGALTVAKKLIQKDKTNPIGYSLAAAAYSGLGDKANAANYFKKVLKVDSTNGSAMKNLAQLELVAGNQDKAREYYLKAIQSHPRDISAMTALAKLEQQQGNSNESTRWLKKIIAIDSKQLAPQLILIQSYMQEKNYRSAIQLATEVAEKHGDKPAVSILLARNYLAIQDTLNAKKWLKFASELEHVSATELLQISQMQRSLSESVEALYSIKKAVKLNPGLLATQAELVLLTAAMGDTNAALKRTESLRKAHPKKAIGYALAGDVLIGAKQYHQAIQYFQKAQQLEPGPELASRIYRVKVQLSAGDTNKKSRALAELAKWSDTLNDKSIRQMLAIGYLETGKYQQSLKLFNELLKADPNNAALLNNLAILYHKTGNKNALKLARKAYKLAPERVSTLDTLGWILVQSGDAESALRYLREAYDRASEVPEVRYHLGSALYTLGKKSEARRHIAASVNSGKHFDGLKEARALLKKLNR